MSRYLLLSFFFSIFRVSIIANENEPNALPEFNAKSDPMPKGIYAAIKWDKDPQIETWKNPCLEGVVIRKYWRDFNPDSGVYDWSKLKKPFADAKLYGKKIHLMIAPGFFAPEWVLKHDKVDTVWFNAPAGKDGDDDDGNIPDPIKGKPAPLPLPWNEAYLKFWFEFVDALAKEFGSKEALAYVSVTGPNSHNGEVNLPHEDDDLKKWLQLMDVPDDELAKQEALKTKMQDAYKKTIIHFDKAFSPYGVYFTMAFPQQALPISHKPSNGEIQKKYQAFLIHFGATKHKSYFGLQNNGLSGLPLSEPFKQWLPVREYAGKILTGFQTRAPKNLYADIPVSSSEKERIVLRRDIMRQTLLNGIRYGGCFIEVYESDTLDPNLKDVIAAAAKLLSGEEKDCHCE